MSTYSAMVGAWIPLTVVMVTSEAHKGVSSTWLTPAVCNWTQCSPGIRAGSGMAEKVYSISTLSHNSDGTSSADAALCCRTTSRGDTDRSRSSKSSGKDKVLRMCTDSMGLDASTIKTTRLTVR